MATVTLKWSENPASELVSSYNVYKDGALLGVSVLPEYIDQQVASGVHTYEVAALNVWGESPHSDPVNTPGAPSKPSGLSISITVNVQVG